jgi:hypothetical protein
MGLADGFCPNYKLCEILKFSWWSCQNYCLMRRGMADRRCGRKFHLQQRQTEPLLLWKGCNSFLLNSTYVPNYTASPPRKVIFKWIYAESSSSSRYLFCWLKNCCKLATIWPLSFVYETTASNAVVTRSITYFPRSEFQKNFGTKTPKLCILQNVRARLPLFVLVTEFWHLTSTPEKTSLLNIFLLYHCWLQNRATKI